MRPRSGFRIRHAVRRDLPQLYRVCLKTGRAGEDAGDLYDDGNLLGHLYVGPYVCLEPDLAYALEDADGICGYVLAALDTERFFEQYRREWLPPLQRRIPEPTEEWDRLPASDRLRWRIHHPTLVFPDVLAPFASQLHVDLLPRAQGRGQGRALLEVLLASLLEMRSPGVHLEMDPANRRAEGFYRHLGFSPVHSPDLPANARYLVRKLVG
ncbi:MAG: GNAT family N-acetyltransferase [Trueperaceae bacterium]